MKLVGFLLSCLKEYRTSIQGIISICIGVYLIQLDPTGTGATAACGLGLVSTGLGLIGAKDNSNSTSKNNQQQ